MPSGFQTHITIDCMLSPDSDVLQGDGCIYKLTASQPHIINPEQLQSGDYVKIRLWLPDDTTHVVVDLAEIQWIKQNWIKVEILIVSQKDQARLKQFLASQMHSIPARRTASEQLLIRA